MGACTKAVFVHLGCNVNTPCTSRLHRKKRNLAIKQGVTPEDLLVLRHFLDETDTTELDSVGYGSGAERRVCAALAGMVDESGRPQQATPFGLLVSAVHHLRVG